jgi:hypothetical protein
MATYIHGVPESQRRAAEVANALLRTANVLQQSEGGSAR